MKKERTMNCQECSTYLYGYLQDAENIPSAVLGHIDNCVSCREQIGRLRSHLSLSCAQQEQSGLLRKHLQLHARLLNRWVSCDEVKPFLPALLVNGLQISIRTPVTAHIEHCSQCRTHLAEIQSLGLSQEQLVAAGTFLSASGKAEALPAKAEPVLQAVLESERSNTQTRLDDDASSGIRIRHCSQTTNRSRSIRYLLTGSLAAAAVFLVVSLLPTAAIGNLENVNRAVKSVSEVHLQRYSEKGDLIQEIWISKSLGFKIYKQPQKTFFKNLRSGQIVQITSGSDPVYLTEGLRDDDMYARLLPFDQLRDLPSQYEWNFVEDGILGDKRVHIYELTWQQAGTNMAVYKKWRAALDPQTFLPSRIEWYEKMEGEPDYILITRSEVAYPSKVRFLQKLEQEGLHRLLTGDHIE
jgi:hypothetical protein